MSMPGEIEDTIIIVNIHLHNNPKLLTTLVKPFLASLFSKEEKKT